MNRSGGSALPGRRAGGDPDPGTTTASDGPDPASEDKSAARRRARAARRDLVAARRTRDDGLRLAQHVLTLVAAHAPGPRRVAAYVAYGVEPPTGALVAALTAAGHEVVLPRTLEDRSLEWVDPGGRLLGAHALGGAAVVVTPGLAVDRSGTRLGQGGGSYDRALADRGRDTLVVTLLHDGELLDPGLLLPCSALDQPVDGVVTADGGFVDLR